MSLRSTPHPALLQYLLYRESSLLRSPCRGWRQALPRLADVHVGRLVNGHVVSIKLWSDVTALWVAHVAELAITGFGSRGMAPHVAQLHIVHGGCILRPAELLNVVGRGIGASLG